MTSLYLVLTEEDTHSLLSLEKLSTALTSFVPPATESIFPDAHVLCNCLAFCLLLFLAFPLTCPPPTPRFCLSCFETRHHDPGRPALLGPFVLRSCLMGVNMTSRMFAKWFFKGSARRLGQRLTGLKFCWRGHGGLSDPWRDGA